MASLFMRWCKSLTNPGHGLTNPGHSLVVHEMVQEPNDAVSEEIDGVGVAEYHGQVTQNLLLPAADAVQEHLQLARPAAGGTFKTGLQK